MDTYKAWVRQNRQWIASLESIANTLTWFLPERFTSSEVGTESVAALLGLMTVINQYIVDTTPQVPEQVRYVTGLGVPASRGDQQGYLPLSFCLSVVKELEVLIEVAAEYYQGRDRKWNILAAVEAIKACLRFSILHRSGYKMLVDGGETRHVEGGPGASQRDTGFAGSSRERDLAGRQMRHLSTGYMGHVDATQGTGQQDLERKATLALIKFGEKVGINTKPSWANRQKSISDTAAEVKNISCTSKSFSFASLDLPDEVSIVRECLFILRPLIYVLLIRQYGLTSWKPWLTSFALDITGMSAIFVAGVLRKRMLAPVGNVQKDGHLPLSGDEVQELKRRQLLCALYLMRDPFFSTYTRYPLLSTERIFRPVPLLGLLGGKVLEFVAGIQARYCYTSGS